MTPWSLYERPLFPEDSQVAGRGHVWTSGHCLHVLSQRDRVKWRKSYQNVPSILRNTFRLPSIAKCWGLRMESFHFLEGFPSTVMRPTGHSTPTPSKEIELPYSWTPLPLCPDTPGPQGLFLLQRHCFLVSHKSHSTFKNHSIFLMS